MAVNFYLEKRTNKNGDAPIRISATIKGARYLTSSGCSISCGKWDAEKQRVKRGCINANGITYNVINARLAKIIELYTTYENECLINSYKPTKQDLIELFANKFGRRLKGTLAGKREKKLFDYLHDFTDEMGTRNEWTKATYQKFNALENHLKGFNENLSFADITETCLNNFVTYLRNKLDMKNSTIGNQLGFLKWFLRWADMRGYCTENAYKTFTPKLKTAAHSVVFLDWEELMKVYEFAIPANGAEVTLTNKTNGKTYKKIVHDAAALKKTRDIFCFCCFTSLRYSDANNLKKADVRDNEKITLTTIKTSDTITIELNKYAKSILDKYRDADFGGYALPRITNQRMNGYLKDLCELCGINQPITKTYYRGNERVDEVFPKYALIGTHTGRRTFICNALMLGIPAEIVMKWTGHSDYKSMKPYIDVTNAAKEKAMQLFDNI